MKARSLSTFVAQGSARSVRLLLAAARRARRVTARRLRFATLMPEVGDTWR